MRFGVHHEWGRLREAIVGIPSLAESVAREGVTVRQPDGPPCLVRDALVVVGNHAIEGALRQPGRHAERFAVRPFVQKAALERGARWSSVPPGWPNAVDGPFLEGGDVLLNGREIYVGMSGLSSDLAGIDWLEALLGAGYRVIPVPLKSDVTHLQDVLALVRPGLLLWCADRLVDGLPTSLRGWEAIAVPKGEADLLVLDEGRAMARRENVRVVEALRARRMDVVPVACDCSLRAAHHPLLRESILE